MKALKVALLLLLTLLLVTQPISAAYGLWIEVVPLSKNFRKLPVKIYWKPSETCPAEFNEVLKKTLDAAIILLRKSVWRFMEENDGQFDEMITFRIEYTDNPEEAQIIVSGDNLEPGVAGITAMGVSDEGLEMVEIIYDCDVVLRPMVPAFNVVLHELLHGLGLGHTYFDKVGDQWEIMAESKREGEPTIYVSTLDLHALYQIWFTKYRGDTVGLPQDLEFREVKPYVVELEELKKIYEDLHRKYGVLEGEIASLKDDLKILEKRVDELEQNVATISTKVSSLEKRATNLEEEVETISETVETISSEVSQVAGGLESVNATMREWMGEVRGSLETLSTRIAENQREIREHSQLLASQQQVIESLNSSLQEAMKYLKILILLTAISLAIGTTALIKTLKEKKQKRRE